MRNLLFGIAALLAMSVPAIASADTGGSVALTYAGIDSDLVDSKDNVVALSGVVITDLPAAGWRLQANASTADADLYDDSYGYSQGEIHATYDAGAFQVGGFLGMDNLTGYGYYEYGVEAAYNFSRGQIAASAAGATSPNSDVSDVSTYAVAGRFDITDAWHVGAVVSSTDIDDADDNIDSWGVDVGYNIPNTDLTISAGYRSSDFADDTVNFAGVSLAWNFGSGAGGREMLGADALIPDAIVAE